MGAGWTPPAGGTPVGTIDYYGGTFVRGRWVHGNTGALGTSAMHADYLNLVPVLIQRAVSVNSVGIRITTAGSAGSVIRLGVFSLAGNTATTIVDAGTVDGTATGWLQADFSAVELEPGLHLIGSVSQGDPDTPPTMSRTSEGRNPLVHLSDNTVTSTIQGVYAVTGVTGAFGATLALGSTGIAVPNCAIRVAA